MGVGEEDSNHQLMKGVGSELNRKAARVIVPWARVKFNQSRQSQGGKNVCGQVHSDPGRNTEVR